MIQELSNVSSQLFDLQYETLTMLKRNKVPIKEANITQLNFFGNKFLKYAQHMLQELFPRKSELVF